MRTVRCSYCHMTGHNRRGCPERKKFIQNNPESWEASYEERLKRRARKDRRCSFCHDTGHTRRTCPSLTKAVAAIRQADSEHRRKLIPVLQASGLRPGALLLEKTWRGEEHSHLVTGIDWSLVSFRKSKSYTSWLKTLRIHDGRQSYLACPYDESLPRDVVGYRDSCISLVSSGDEPLTPPDGWLDGESEEAIRTWLKEDKLTIRDVDRYDDCRNTQLSVDYIT